ncbi:MAG: chemotaxis protein CheW [Polyangiaceae bacterium]
MPPRVLLVDDSEAVLAYERAALSQHYAIDVATDGIEGLSAARALSPAVVVLDLSMPRMDGDDVLATLKGDPLLRDIPVVVVSSEETRGRACLTRGAAAFLPKPVRAPDLLAAVNRAYDEAAARRDAARLSVLYVDVGTIEMGISVTSIDSVMLQPDTQRTEGPDAVRESVEISGETIAMLDLAACFDVPHAVAPVDRKVVVIKEGDRRLALSVDSVRGLEEIDPRDVIPAKEATASEVAVIAQTSRGTRAIVGANALFSLDRLPLVASVVRGAQAVHPGSAGIEAYRAPSDDTPDAHAKILGQRAARAKLRRPAIEEEPHFVAQLRVGGEPYALPFESLLGIAPFSALVPVPLAPRPVLGVLYFRGEIITALRTAWLAGAREPPHAPTSLLVAHTSSGRRFAMDCSEIPAVIPLRRDGTATVSPVRLLDLDRALDRLEHHEG